MQRPATLLLALGLAACSSGKDTLDTGPLDIDGDGWTATDDCDDLDASVHPDATEYCDGQDNDCDGAIDEDSAYIQDWYLDDDGDDHGQSDVSVPACAQPEGYAPEGADCDDTDAAINPDADEVCDGVDNDCDGTIDISADGAAVWYTDADGDGYGDPASTVSSCQVPGEAVANDDDCDDTHVDVYLGAPEICDGVDNDCNGLADDADGNVLGTTWYADLDGDGYGGDRATAVACIQPTGTTATADDCDDLDAAVNPGAAEVCDRIDDNCDGLVDDGDPSTDPATMTTWYTDADSDGYGDAASATTSCSQPSGTITDATDCDDANASANPSATEVCNGIDDNCDSSIDESTAADASIWYADSDSDTYGDAASTTVACDLPSGYVADATDCDDTSSGANPGASEVCNGVDDNCDGSIDESTAADASIWYADSDSDGHGDSSTSTVACNQPTGYVADATDCDDTSASVSPVATELCNGIDDNCDGSIDESTAADAPNWYADTDSDTYGDLSTTSTACSQPTGYVSNDTDCDDASASVNPGATEVCNSIDDNCDGVIDPATSADATTWYADSDGDGYGSAAAYATACSAPSSFVVDATDCDDGDAIVYPGATELCDGVQEDCSASWTSDAGLASFQSASTGAWTDYSSTLAAGTSSSPVSVTLSTAGTLYLCAGTWYAGLVASANMTIVGLDGPDSVILDGGGSTTLVANASSADVTLQDLTLTSGRTSGSGGAVALFGGTHTLDNLNLASSTAGTDGGCVDVDSATLSLTDVTMTGCGGALGGALVSYYSTVDANNVDIVDSVSIFGAVLVFGGSLTGTNMLFAGNTSPYADGAGLAMESATVDISDSYFVGNHAYGDGGAVLMFSGTSTFTRVLFAGNQADGGAGGIGVNARSTTTLDTCTFTGNVGSTAGGIGMNGAWTSTTSSATVITSDFSGETPNDVKVYGLSPGYSYGSGASFTCTPGPVGCL